MNDGVALLLDRMKTNPEEFVPNNGSSKWGSLISAYKEFLEPEDRQALSLGINKLLQQAFTEKVMEELVDPKRGSALRQLQEAVRKNTPAIKSVPFNLVEHIEAHEKFIGQTPIAGVTQTL
jgi:hypothetical protein